MSQDHTFWFLTRAAGLTAYVLLFATVVLGLTMTGGLVGRLFRRYHAYDLHRFVSLLALGMVSFHVVIVLPDAYFRFNLAQLLVPFASPYRPLFLALGLGSLYTMGVIVVTFYLPSLVPYRAWRLIHYATFGAFALALAHGVGAGADSGAGWARYLYAGTGLVVFNLTVYRMLLGSARPGREPPREAAAGLPAARGAAASASGLSTLATTRD